MPNIKTNLVICGGSRKIVLISILDNNPTLVVWILYCEEGEVRKQVGYGRLIIKEDVAPKFISLPQVCLGAYQDFFFF